MSGAALVTGGAQRLGAAMSRYLATRGYAVAVHYNTSSDEADTLVTELTGQGVRAVALGADLLDEAATETLVARASKALGQPLTCLINNASIFEYDTIHTATRESWDRHIGSNLRAPYVLTQAFAAQAPVALTDENGEALASSLVINMVDQRVRKVTPEFSTYTIAKMGLWALTQTAAQGLAPAVRVNAIGPGPTLIGARQTEAHFARQRENTVLGRGANPADVTAALGYFLDAPAVTGQLLCVDGGQHLGWKTPDVLGVE
ncbi:SDR family oxidoreductase [Lentibacter sp. XHP0401]|uniref:SDR family oxidoreductase n=1 Tax=Lentibacter sp. XHP0401 TaxID=2984334 RepID=UPI0021E71674|nr:SDR family oxidoreductase [Lentibacter sp. XHP0401]MCV2892895.1 SDR family oxidoreductase [Lentibacter sp. XHP0401]